ncbi:MAG: DUF2497 domain-containing protein [Rhizobiales bacterium]|nr:DUF2497 domain-containing protein [Hyphomicrobiales bacterium]
MARLVRFNENLAGIVERLVRAEIHRVAGRGF